MSRPGLLSGLVLCLLLAACTNERIVLLPSSDGRPSAVVVREGTRETVLDRPYASLRHLASTLSYQATESDIQERFGEALASRPAWPRSYTLYFERGGEQLTEESLRAFTQFRQEIAQRPAPEIMVIGHTDSVGPAPLNDALSLKRAEAVRDLLIADGVSAASIEAVGRGERDLLVPTADEVDEAQNRRVEINLR